jgi:hypothetical protein
MLVTPLLVLPLEFFKKNLQKTPTKNKIKIIIKKLKLKLLINARNTDTISNTPLPQT